MANFLTGKSFWQTQGDGTLPSLFFSDGPSGLRKQEGKPDYFGKYPSLPSRLYPCGAAIGAGWDEENAEQVGLELARDMQAQGVDMLLGPCVDHKRSPLAGRSFESLSEDPEVSARLAAAQIRGIHRGGKLCCLKHLTGNTQEAQRMSINMVMDEKTREFYTQVFRRTVQLESPDAIMTAYPKLNGTFCTENKALMDEIREAGFDGLYVSDWGSVNEPETSFKAGLNLEMPGNPDTQVLEPENGQTKAILQKLAERRKEIKEAPDDGPLLAAARNAHVLVKQGRKPDPEKPLALIGEPKVQGTGSSRVNPLKMTTFQEAWPGIVWQAKKFNDSALEVARLAGQAVLLLSPEEEGEGHDRRSMGLKPEQEAFVERLLQENIPVTLVIQTGSPVQMDWFDRLKGEDMVIIQYLAGQYAQKALADVLGDVPFSGFLPESWPLNFKSTPVAPFWHKDRHHAVYGEGLFSGYRYYKSAGKPVRFSFGYGLQNTEFETRQEGNTVTVTNTGTETGHALVVLYRMQDTDNTRPLYELADFRKVKLEPGESKTVPFNFPEKWLLELNGKEIHRQGTPGTYRMEFPTIGVSKTAPEDWNVTWHDLEGPVLKAIRNVWEKAHSDDPYAGEVLSDLTVRQLVLAGWKRKNVKKLARFLLGRGKL